MAYKIAVDTGGTFTDVVVSDETGQFIIGKALTTPARVFAGVREGIMEAASQMGLPLERLLGQTATLIYGTTRATNAIVTKKTAKTAFLTTKGFADTLLLKEGGKFGPHDFSKDYPAPYVPRTHTFEILERMSSEGTPSIPFDHAEAKRTALAVKARRFEAVAVSFLWSIANPDHELAMARILDEVMPDVPYTLSHRLVPILREYRRASATAIDASLKPLMQEHLRGLESDLRAAGFTGELLVSTAAGGCNKAESLVERPIYTIGSGPAMAPVAASAFARQEALGENIIVCDTGGTTFDVGLVRDGRLTYSRDAWIGERYTGDLLGISTVDMRSIGAGGGSIAWIDRGGLMRVGPDSAGAEPGPACYGRGGELPTVSDAAAVLGYFDPDFFLGGRMKLDLAAARRVIGKIAGPLGLTLERAAYQTLSLAGEFMIRAIYDITISEGVDPRESLIVAGGGAAGLNILMIARELGCNRVLLPKAASALSAAGMQYADIVAEESASFVTLSSRCDIAGVTAMLAELTARLEDFRKAMGESGRHYRIEYFTEARYLSQVWELDTPIASAVLRDGSDVDALVEAFHRVHERVFAVRDEASPVEFVNWKARLTIDLGRKPFQNAANGAAAHPAHRDCFFGDDRPVRTAVWDASTLSAGARVAGPAIIQEPTTTVVVYPGTSAEITPAGNYILHAFGNA